MKILAIETSYRNASVTLKTDTSTTTLVSESNLKHEETIFQLISNVLEANNTKISEIDCTAVNVGPGSFTGIRIGITIANGLSFAQSVPCVPVNALDAMYYSCKQEGTTTVFIDAKVNVFYAKYINGQCVEKPQSCDKNVFLSNLKPEGIVVGNFQLDSSQSKCFQYYQPNSFDLAKYAYNHYENRQPTVQAYYLLKSSAERKKDGGNT